MSEKSPLMSFEDEQRLLGALMLDPERLPEVAQALPSKEFHDQAHRRIYAAMVRLHEAGELFDVVMLKDELARVGQLNATGGPEYLLQLTETIASAAEVFGQPSDATDTSPEPVLISAADVKVDRRPHAAVLGFIRSADKILDRCQTEDELREVVDRAVWRLEDALKGLRQAKTTYDDAQSRGR